MACPTPSVSALVARLGLDHRELVIAEGQNVIGDLRLAAPARAFDAAGADHLAANAAVGDHAPPRRLQRGVDQFGAGLGLVHSAALALGGAAIFYFGEVELGGGVVDIETDHVAVGIEIDDEALDDLARLSARDVLSARYKGCRFPDNSAASWLALAEIPVEERVVDSLAVRQCYNPQEARSSFSLHRNPAPMPDTVVALDFAADRRGEHLTAPVALDIGPLSQHLLLEVSRRLQVMHPFDEEPGAGEHDCVHSAASLMARDGREVSSPEKAFCRMDCLRSARTANFSSVSIFKRHMLDRQIVYSRTDFLLLRNSQAWQRQNRLICIPLMCGTLRPV